MCSLSILNVILQSLIKYTNYLISISVFGLECYVCKNQEDNNEKCVKTIKTCEYDQDVCLTEIKWGSTPYWSQGAKKQYYVSKRCSNRTDCATTRERYMPTCTHIWYQDWVCSDCCQGDRCNYYIIVSKHFYKIVLYSFKYYTNIFFLIYRVKLQLCSQFCVWS